MRNTLLCSVLAVTGLLVCWNVPVVIAASEETEHQATQHEAAVTAQPKSCEMMCGKDMPGMCRGWSCHRSRPEACCALGLLGAALLVWLTCNVLLAAWIFTDIRKQGQGHGVFVALALLAGFPTAIVYALIRIGDKKG